MTKYSPQFIASRTLFASKQEKRQAFALLAMMLGALLHPGVPPWGCPTSGNAAASQQYSALAPQVTHTQHTIISYFSFLHIAIITISNYLISLI